MTHKRIAALRTAADFRAYLAALGVTLPFDETLTRPSPLAAEGAPTADFQPRDTNWSTARNFNY